MKRNALILGSSKGIGQAALKAALSSNYEAQVVSSKDIDISSSESINSFANKIKDKDFDLIFFNSGGLPPFKYPSEKKSKDQIELSNTLNKSLNAHTMGYVKLFDRLSLNKNCLLIHVSSHIVVNKEAVMFASAVARSAMEKFMEYLPVIFPDLNLVCINLRFGPVLTDRLSYLLSGNSIKPENLMQKLGSTSENPISVDEVERLISYIINTGRFVNGSCTLNCDSGIGPNLNILP